MRPKAVALLGSNFVMHVLSRATFTYDRGGLARFRDNFDPQGLLPLPPQARDLLPAWQRCTACGLCDLVCPTLLGNIAAQRFAGPQAVASGLLRNLPDLAITSADAEPLYACDGCHACEDICPQSIPLRDLAAFLIEAGQEARQANPGKALPA